MTPCPSDPQLRAFQVGKLPEPDLSLVAEHLESCAACESRAQVLDTETDSILAALRESAPHWSLWRTGTGTQAAGPAPATAAPDAAYPFLQPPVMPDEIGRLGEYRVLRLLGKGGMGYVFLGEDIALSRPVAIKIMKPDLDSDGESWQRFLREARLLANLKHEHLVTIYRASQEGNAVYLVMELLQGETLLDWLKKGPPVDAALILRLAGEIASALAVIHRHGLIHRDIKPANIWLEDPGQRVKILDFGLARHQQDSAALTQSGMVVGTPSFMSPEQARGEAVDPRSDLFSLGAVLYCLCTGREPFRGANVTAVLTALAIDTPRPVHELAPFLPRPLADLVMQLLAKRPEERPPSAEAVVERLRHISPVRADSSATRQLPAVGLPAPAPRPSRRALLIGAAALLVLAALMLAAGIVGNRVRPTSPSLAAATRPATAPDTADGPPVYLNHWKPVDSAHWPLPLTPKGDQMPNVFEVISVNGKESPHGIGLHPSFDGPASVSFSLGKQYRTFQGTVSLNDTVPASESPMTFTVYGDGKLLWRSKPVSSAEDSQEFRVPVQDVDVLKLEVATRGRAKGCHGVFLEPHLRK